MAKVAVFDSGLGSLSVIRAIQKISRPEIIYFADQHNFPYGAKTSSQLYRIIRDTIQLLQEKFSPDVIVMASNTPSLILKHDRQILGVYPPIKAAAQFSATKNIAILGTRSTVNSRRLDEYIARQRIPKSVTVHKIDASQLIDLVQSGRFLTDKDISKKKIKKLLGRQFAQNSIDAATLSSTHLPFLMPLLRLEFSDVRFLDPADVIATHVVKKIGAGGPNRLRVYASGDVQKFERILARLGVKRKVRSLTF